MWAWSHFLPVLSCGDPRVSIHIGAILFGCGHPQIFSPCSSLGFPEDSMHEVAPPYLPPLPTPPLPPPNPPPYLPPPTSPPYLRLASLDAGASPRTPLK